MNNHKDININNKIEHLSHQMYIKLKEKNIKIESTLGHLHLTIFNNLTLGILKFIKNYNTKNNLLNIINKTISIFKNQFYKLLKYYKTPTHYLINTASVPMILLTPTFHAFLFFLGLDKQIEQQAYKIIPELLHYIP